MKVLEIMEAKKRLMYCAQGCRSLKMLIKIYKRERGYLNSIGATRGKNLFEGVETI